MSGSRSGSVTVRSSPRNSTVCSASARQNDPDVGARVPGAALVVAEDGVDAKAGPFERLLICGTDSVRNVSENRLIVPLRPRRSMT